MTKGQVSYNDYYREKTLSNAMQVFHLFKELKKSEELKIIGKQLLRSSSSVAANFRATCRARSKAEYYSKLCIVVEECDETLFWLEFLEKTGSLPSHRLATMITNTKALLMAFAKTRKQLKTKEQS